MFDIVSKNKKLSFLVSFIKDTVSQTEKTCHDLLTIQKNSVFNQQKIETIKKTIVQHSFSTQSLSTQPNKNYTKKKNPLTSSIRIQDVHTHTHKTNNTMKDYSNNTVRNDSCIPYSVLYTSEHKTIILDSVTQPEYLLYAFLICVDSNFIHTQDHLKNKLINTLKYKLAIELDTKNLYTEFNYNKVRSLKKTLLQDSLFNNKDIHYIHLYRYLGDYFNVNFIHIIDDIFVQYFNEYKHDRIHIIITQNKNTVCIDTSTYNEELICVKEFKGDNYILFPGQTVKAYNKLKVTEIRKIAEKKNINLYICGLKKKTKKILIEEILQL